ncbi:sensor histidine kinase [Castellaniella sp.]|uniref:sensor histidine kinase n=1 Tax=Castellaniella sp. TaxID=1955812 RepID=UPI002B000703|nr:sensor histidine kinase N-terminal domain-containing protein [Castellaniella sp.]
MFADSRPAYARRRRRRRHATLLGRILLWMIVPLFVLWSIGIVITYFISLNIANSPYDRTLSSHLRLLRHEVEQQRLSTGITLSESARTILAGSGDDTPTTWQILDANGHLMAGNPNIPTPENWTYDIDQVRYRNATLNHQAIRLAYLWGGRDRDGTGFLTVVAEPGEARATLQQEILTGMLTPQLIILPLAAMLAGLGLTQGLEPLSLLQEHMRRRKPSDLSPIRDDLAPAEIVPLIAAMNNVLQRLSASIESQRRFVANAAHQLKTPLAGIRTQCEIALREQEPARMRDSLQQLITGSQRATRLVNQLLLLARAESLDPNQSRTTEQLNLHTLAAEGTGAWVQTALQRGIDLGFESSDENLPVFGNGIMIRELLNNLIDNALLYTPAGGQVTVRVLADGDLACLEVQDTGPGIPLDEQSQVFDRFYRILGHEAEGSGLGLAIVREVAEHHQASIAFLPPGNHYDPVSAGTRLRVSFPRDHVPRTRT